MKFHMHNKYWEGAKTYDNWQSFSDSEDDLETIESVTMINLPQPISAYVPYNQGIGGIGEEDDFSVLTDFTGWSTTGSSLGSTGLKGKIAECMGKHGLGQGNLGGSGNFRIPRKSQFSQNSKVKNEDTEDSDEVVYLKTVPPPHMIIDLTMDDN